MYINAGPIGAAFRAFLGDASVPGCLHGESSSFAQFITNVRLRRKKAGEPMMNASKIQVWAATCEDKPGAVMQLLEGLARAGANLKFVFGRRLDNEPGKGVVFVSPLEGDRQLAAAAALGFAPTRKLFAVHVEGADEPGLAYSFASALEREGINMNVVSGMVVRGQFAVYLAFDTPTDAERAIERLNQL